jgi:hypothetical protein
MDRRMKKKIPQRAKDSLHAYLFTLQAHRSCKFQYLQAHHQFYRPEFENYINDHKIIKPPKLKT